MRTKYLILFSFFTIISTGSFSQTKFDNLLVKLNKIHKENRVILTGKIQEIYVNKTNKTLDIDSYVIPINNYTAKYNNSYNKFHNKNLDIVTFSCITGNCIIDRDSNENAKGVGLFFKSKKACYDFINLLDEIKNIILQ